MSTYLITGASSGIGAACAKKLSDAGHNLVLVARDEEKLRKYTNSLGKNDFYFAYDLEDMHNIRSIFEFCKMKNLKLDGMIYSAGINADVPLKVCTTEMFEKVMRVNCIAFAEMGKYFYNKNYSNEYSRIVAISSSASITCDKGMGPYSASKAALNSIVKTMSKEFIRRGILVNAILPAGVLTPMAATKIEAFTGNKLDIENMIKNIESNNICVNEKDDQPLGIITPNNIADIVYYLVSSNNRYVTGALLPISAGRNIY